MIEDLIDESLILDPEDDIIPELLLFSIQEFQDPIIVEELDLLLKPD
jgi:hypothetical protein